MFLLFYIVISVNLSLGAELEEISSVVDEVVGSVAEKVKSNTGGKIPNIEGMEYYREPSKAYMCATGTSLEGLSTFSYKVNIDKNRPPKPDNRVHMEVLITHSDLWLHLNRVVMTVQKYEFMKNSTSYYVNKKQKIRLKELYLKLSYEKSSEDATASSSLKNCEIQMEVRWPLIFPLAEHHKLSKEDLKREGEKFRFILFTMIGDRARDISPVFFKTLIESFKTAVESDGRCTYKGEIGLSQLDRNWDASSNSKKPSSDIFDLLCVKGRQVDKDVVAKKPGLLWILWSYIVYKPGLTMKKYAHKRP